MRRSFSSFVSSSPPSTSTSSLAPSPQPAPLPQLSPSPDDSGFTISAPTNDDDDDDDDDQHVVTSPTDFRHPFDAELDAKRATRTSAERKGKGREKRTYTQIQGEDKVKVGTEVWTALEIEFHGDGWEEAASRVHSISSPLAEQGISILFLSTYQSDYILVPSSHLSSVTATLEKSGFRFNLDDSDSDDDSASAAGGRDRDRRGSVGPMSPILTETDKMRRSFSYTSTTSVRRGNSTASRHSSTGGGSMTNSLVLSEHSAASASSGGISVLSRSESAARAHPPVPVDPPTPEDTDFTLPPGSLSLLADELVCVGLSAGREAGWREKIIQALFFPDKVLPGADGGAESSPGTPAGLTPSIKSISLSRSNSGASGSLSREFRNQRSKSRARSKSNLLRDALGESQQATPRTGHSRTRGSAQSSPPSRQASLVPAEPARPKKPTPFIALTSVVGQTSLTADVRLLRALFTPAEEEDMVFSIGNGGLAGLWQGEEEEDGDDGEREREREDDVGPDEGGSPRSGRGRARARSRPSEGLRLYGTAESESDQSGDDEDDWDKVDQSRERRREIKRKREMAKEAGEGGRRLLKCLQLDLTGFALGTFSSECGPPPLSLGRIG